MKTLEGTRRYLITRTTTDTPDTFEALPAEFRDTISEVHFADGSNTDLLGMEGSYSISLDEEWIRKVREASNLVDLSLVDPARLGEHIEHTTSEEIDDLTQMIEVEPERAALDSVDGARREKYWRPWMITDQGSEGSCTGHCGQGFLTASPIRSFISKKDVRWHEKRAWNLYKQAQKNDEWPGEDYSGSSISAICKIFLKQKRIEKAGVTTSLDTMISWLLSKGPLMLSTPWHEGMYRTDSRGFIRPTGKKVGGHAIVCFGVSKWRTLYLANSWGRDFGINGVGYLAEADMKWLIRNGLRAYAAEQVKA